MIDNKRSVSFQIPQSSSVPRRQHTLRVSAVHVNTADTCVCKYTPMDVYVSRAYTYRSMWVGDSVAGDAPYSDPSLAFKRGTKEDRESICRLMVVE